MTMQDVVETVNEAGGVAKFDLGQLRDAVDADKLGKLVMGRISQELAAHGLGYFPRELIDANPAPRQTQQIRVYRKGSGPAAKVIEAVLDPNPQGDRYLNELAGDDAQQVLARVRELVSPDL